VASVPDPLSLPPAAPAPVLADPPWSGLPLRLALGAAGLLLAAPWVSAPVGRAGLAGLGLTAAVAAAWRLRQRWSAQAEAWRALADAEHRQSRMLAMAVDGLFELDASGALVRHEGAATDAPLLEAGDLGLPPWDWPGAQLSALDRRRLEQALVRGQTVRDLAMPRVDAQGRSRHWRLSLRPLSDRRFGGLLRDVSAEAQVLAALRHSEARFQELFRRLPQPLVVHREGRVLDANPAAVAMFGLPDLASMVGFDLTAAYQSGESRERALARLREIVTLPPGRHLPSAEFHLEPRPGEVLIVQASSVAVEAEDGQPAVLTIYLDDTEHRQAEQALQRSEALLSHLVANSPDLVTLTDMATGRYLMVNPSFTRLTGWSVDEAVGRTSTDLGVWARPGERERLVEQLQREGTVRNLPMAFRVRDGSLVSMLVSAARFSMEGRDHLIITCRDISATEQQRLVREAILENAQMGIALTRDYAFLLANPHLEQMLGWPRGSLVGRHLGLVWPSPEDFRDLAADVVPRLNRGELVEIEREMQRRDGSTFTCRLLAKAVDPEHPSRGGTIWFAEDITQRRLTERALAKARDDAEAASRAKSAFLASTSHELRTPLNALLGLAQLARQPALDEARRRQYIEQISDSAQTLSAILTDILDLSKIEAGKMHLERQPFDLHALLRSLQEAYGTLADTQGLRLHLELDDDLPRAVVGDPLRVRQILSNYLNNALKFTPAGSVLLAARVLRPDLLRFEVVDTGRGIDPATQERLFVPFAQGDSSGTRAVGGTGLGLSICRELATLMEGRVGVVSTPGLGSCFWAELPLPPTDQAALESGDSDGQANPVQGARILMVEDNPVNMMIAAAMLEQWGAEVAQAADGESAVEAVDAAADSGRPFALVLMDLQMPGISGHEAARRIRQRHDARALPVIALTAAALVSERDEALAAGMNDFLTKPIDAHRLRHTLVRWLRATPAPAA
jgi:PAS domain S-box-containing protein